MRVRGAVLILLFFLGAARDASAADAPCTEHSFEDTRFTVCAYDPRRAELRLAWTGRDGQALQTFDRLSADLGKTARHVRFAMNAGMFEVGGMPLGLYVESGVERRPVNERNGGGNFYLKPNGVFSQTPYGTLRIDTTEGFLVRSDRPLWATQSGPMLVIDGAFNRQITADGPSRNIRNGVGLRSTHSAFFVISDEPVSFGKLARFFRDGLACPNALYFDGTVSSLWLPSEARKDNAAPLGPMVVVLDKH
ncbi:MAG TPA: phosphodiester glycosidase family protein [Rhizomicrobium sp.]|jgi:uncharacterized protein YigE (DUF2233 family)